MFDQGTATFYMKNSATAGVADNVFRFGATNRDYLPVTGDWNGDGMVTVGVFDRAASVFLLSNDNGPGIAEFVFQFGPSNSGWLPIVGDWNGDGVDTVGLYDRISGNFFLRDSNSPGAANHVFQFGPGGGSFFPVAGDWNGDGRDDVGIYDGSGNRVAIRLSPTPGPANLVVTLGLLSGELPIAGDFDDDRFDTIGQYDIGSGNFHIKNALQSGGPDAIVRFGPGGQNWIPFTWEGGAQVTALNPNDGRGGFLWKPRGDHTGTLVVLLPSSFNNRAVAVEVHRGSPPSQTTFVEGGRYTGIANQNRGHWRFRQSGGSYGQNLFVIVFTNDGQTFSYFIPNGANRVD